jgi:transcriptional regulator with XRE-family HTH domain
MNKRRYKKIRRLMITKGVSGAEIARQIGVTRNLINGVILGYWESPRAKQAVADALGVPYEKLWGKKKEEVTA